MRRPSKSTGSLEVTGSGEMIHTNKRMTYLRKSAAAGLCGTRIMASAFAGQKPKYCNMICSLQHSFDRDNSKWYGHKCIWDGWSVCTFP
jgi:hypothetical protein